MVCSGQHDGSELMLVAERLAPRITHCNTQERNVHLSADDTVLLLVESKTTGKVAHTEYEQDV